MDSIPIAILGILATPLGIFLTWFLNRRKNIADIYDVLTDSSQTAVELMQQTMLTLNDQLTIANERIAELQKTNEQLISKVAKLDEMADGLMIENTRLADQVHVCDDK